MKTSHYLKKAGAVCMAAAMMTGCASGSSGTNGKTRQLLVIFIHLYKKHPVVLSQRVFFMIHSMLVLFY